MLLHAGFNGTQVVINRATFPFRTRQEPAYPDGFLTPPRQRKRLSIIILGLACNPSTTLGQGYRTLPILSCKAALLHPRLPVLGHANPNSSLEIHNQCISSRPKCNAAEQRQGMRRRRMRGHVQSTSRCKLDGGVVGPWATLCCESRVDVKRRAQLS